MIFLMCSERSGSNLLRTLLGRHPCISAPPPPHLLKTFVPLLPLYGNLETRQNFERLLSDIVYVTNAQIGTWTIKLDKKNIAQRVVRPTFAEVIRVIYQEEAKISGKDHSIIKDNGIIQFPFHINTIFNDAEYIYLVRDPRDCALSWENSITHVGGIAASTKTWCGEQKNALEALSIFQPMGTIKMVKYEDLIGSTSKVLKELCNFIGVAYKPDLLNDERNRKTKENADRIKDWENISKAVMKNNSGKFESELSKRKIKKIETKLATEMAVLGYTPTSTLHSTQFNLDTFGKFYRAVLTSCRLAIGGKSRRAELKIRVHRLQTIRNIQLRLRTTVKQYSTR